MPFPSAPVSCASLTSREVGLACRVVSVVAVLVIPAQQVVDCQVHVQIGPLQLPDNDAPGLALQDHLGLGGVRWVKDTSRLVFLAVAIVQKGGWKEGMQTLQVVLVSHG